MTTTVAFNDMSNAIRALSMDAVEAANSGHPGMPMGMADVATVLFTKFLNYDPKAPHWPDRDRFVLSAGHGSMLLYSLLHLTGYEQATLDQIKSFRQLGSRMAGHPEYGHLEGVETTTGPLGQGLATAVGMAMAERALNAKFGDALVNHKTYVIAGDGCLMEGISHEAISLAGHFKLNQLIVVWDDNNISIDGPVTLAETGNMKLRFEAANWTVLSCDAHDEASVTATLAAAQTSDKPVLIAAKSTIGYGAPTKAGTYAAHGSPLGKAEIEGARAKLGWPYAPFEIPDAVRAAWLEAAKTRSGAHAAWTARYEAANGAVKADFSARLSGALPASLAPAMAAYKASLLETPPKVATRKASEMALDVINLHVPATVGGSADLTGSNLTKTKAQKPFLAPDYTGTYVHYGIREFGMAAAMNGISLHGGFIPYGGGFLIFSDYARPAIRLAALMGIRVVHVLTHDSIGQGEDGPTHQPVEHLASLRAMPNLSVIRPCDAIETAEAWEAALSNTSGPTALVLSRQNVAPMRTSLPTENPVLKGAYVLSGADSADVTIFSTGSEVAIAMKAASLLETDGVSTRVISVPCFEYFERQDAAYKTAILGTSKVKAAVEAAIRQGWDQFIGQDGVFVGMNSFGASAPGDKLYAHFGITAEALVAQIKAKLA